MKNTRPTIDDAFETVDARVALERLRQAVRMHREAIYHEGRTVCIHNADQALYRAARI